MGQKLVCAAGAERSTLHRQVWAGCWLGPIHETSVSLSFHLIPINMAFTGSINKWKSVVRWIRKDVGKE